jgi:hypothetical protein
LVRLRLTVRVADIQPVARTYQSHRRPGIHAFNYLRELRAATRIRSFAFKRARNRFSCDLGQQWRIRESVHTDQRLERSGQALLLVAKSGQHTVGGRLGHAPAVRLFDWAGKHKRGCAIQQQRILKLEVCVAQHHKRRGRLYEFRQLQHRLTNAAVTRRHHEPNFAILPEGRIDKVFDEHTTS